MMKVTLRRALDQLESLEAEIDLVEETLDWVDEAITFNTQALRTDGPLLESLDETDVDHNRLSKVHAHLRQRIDDLREAVLRLQKMAPMAL